MCRRALRPRKSANRFRALQGTAEHRFHTSRPRWTDTRSIVRRERTADQPLGRECRGTIRAYPPWDGRDRWYPKAASIYRPDFLNERTYTPVAYCLKTRALL